MKTLLKETTCQWCHRRPQEHALVNHNDNFAYVCTTCFQAADTTKWITIDPYLTPPRATP